MSAEHDLSVLATSAICHLPTARGLESQFRSASDKATTGIELARMLAKHVDAFLASIAEAADLEPGRWEKVLSDALEGELLFALQQKADEGREEDDDFAEHNTLNCVQQGIGQ